MLISKKGKQTIKCRKKIGQSDSTKEIELSHNRVKNYILKEGTPIPFLIDLGIQTIDGKVVKSKYDKFKQINRYLEFIEDVMDEFKEKQVLTILDFGCGKAYLTFAMYYYFTEIAKKQVKMIGLDLKEEVINNCNNLSQKYGFYGLEFRKGNIEDYNSAQSIDMVVTLHACDTATDYAIYKAIKWNAKVIFSVPCCQHEINKQIKNESMEDILKYGIIKERISALITDAIRANVLEEQGYETQILEFIDMEHTPKNLLIRSIRSDKIKAIGRKKKLQEFYRDFNITPTLVTLLSENQ